MKNRYLLLAALVAALAVAAGPALAAVQGTAHQTAVGAQGVCSACHIPHGGTAGGASRLWPVTPTSTATSPVVVVGTVASLCASCHLSTGAYSASMSAAVSDTLAYHNLGHGGQMTVADMPPGNSMASSGLPYVANATLECTSCHNVHDDVNRPFLRAEMDALCSYCHSDRAYIGGAGQSGSTAAKGAWGSAFVGNTNPGSHPVGTDVTGNVFGGASPITLAGNFIVAKTGAAGTWSLGGHLADNNGTGASTGGVTCNSCHAVHGIQPDGGTATPPTSSFLIVAQSSGTNEGVSGRTIASGDGSVGNGLCEACHVGPAPTGYAGTRAVNPGSGAGTHPVDDYAALYNAVGDFGAAGVTTNWPEASTASGTVGQAAICESCHTPHARANIGRATIVFASGTTITPYILRDTATNICNDCHTGAIAEHHPVGQSIANAKTGAASYLPGGTTLTCGTCHGGAGGGAHNWAGQAQVAMVSGWKPANNARSATASTYRFAASPNPVTTQDISSTCIDCHLDLDATAANTSPTVHNGTAGYGGANNAVDVAQYTSLGTGSHYIGPVAASFFSNKAIPQADRATTVLFNALTDNWTTTVFQAGNASNGISRYGGTASAPILVCESCHSVVPGRNIGNHMLLAQYFEGQETVSGITYDNFCEGCHGVPTGTHQQTGDTVARTNAALNTTIATTRPWLAAAAPTATPATGAQGTSTWGTNKVTCDSCHQVHDAASQGASLIIESPNANVVGGTAAAITVSGTPTYYGGNAINYRLRQQAPAGGSTGVGTMPDVSRFCDQCHTYRQ